MPEPTENPPLPRERQDNPHSHASFLHIRYKKDLVSPDVGDRPLAPGTVFYLSPDISVSPTDTLGNVRAGTEVTVKAQVFNGGGIDAYCVHVEFWWFNPTLAFTAPDPSQRIGSKIVNVPRGNY